MEKRAYPRLEVSHPVLYLADIAARPNVGTTVNLSMEGAGIETLYKLSSGDVLELSIAIDPQVIKCKGKVIHAQWPDGERPRAGVRFDEISEHDRLYLRQYLFHVLEQQAIVSLSQKETPL